jgi:predicted DNA-binding transcriptional regulator YafY
MRAHRLMSLLLLLRSRERATVNQLADRLDVSARTVLRDVDALSAMGIPVYAERGRAGGIRLLPGYSADLHALSGLEAEAMALVNVPAVANGTGLEQPLAAALEKIAAAIPAAFRSRAQHARHRLLFDTTPWFHHSALPPVLELLRSSVWLDQRCRVQYTRSDGATKWYTLEPYALVAMVVPWYLVARSARRMRVFRVQRMQQVVHSDIRFTRDASFDLGSFWHAFCERFERDPGNHYIVELELTPHGKSLLLERYGAWFAPVLNALDAAPHRLRVQLDFEQEHTALEALLLLGRNAQVIGPAMMRNRLRRAANDMLAALPHPGTP